MYVYIYTYIYTYLYRYVCACIAVCIYIYISIYTWTPLVRTSCVHSTLAQGPACLLSAFRRLLSTSHERYEISYLPCTLELSQARGRFLGSVFMERRRGPCLFKAGGCRCCGMALFISQAQARKGTVESGIAGAAGGQAKVSQGRMYSGVGPRHLPELEQLRRREEAAAQRASKELRRKGVLEAESDSDRSESGP